MTFSCLTFLKPWILVMASNVALLVSKLLLFELENGSNETEIKSIEETVRSYNDLCLPFSSVVCNTLLHCFL